MEHWVKLCTLTEAPEPNKACEISVEGVDVCLANVNGELHALDNWCPHRRGPLGQGWVEGGAIVCPWHAWAFDLKTGLTLPPEKSHVDVLPVRVEGDDVLVDIS